MPCTMLTLQSSCPLSSSLCRLCHGHIFLVVLIVIFIIIFIVVVVITVVPRLCKCLRFRLPRVIVFVSLSLSLSL
jgi:hypothetical protein